MLNRRWRRSSLILAGVLLCPAIAFRSSAQPVAGSNSPTLQQTKEWIETEMPPLGATVVTDRTPPTPANRVDTRIHTTYRLEAVRLNACTLDFEIKGDVETEFNNEPEPSRHFTWTYSLVLKNLDVQSIQVAEAYKPTGVEREREALVVHLRYRGSDTVATSINVRDRSGNRIARALQHAAILCGAPRSAF
jgi:hypothetical protein